MTIAAPGRRPSAKALAAVARRLPAPAAPAVGRALRALGLAAASLGLGWPVVAEYLHTGLVPRLPTAVLATSVMLLAFLALAVGLILDTVTRGRQEVKRMQYLSISGVLSTAQDRALARRS